MTQLNDPGRSLDMPIDPFFYGWRPVSRQREDGSTVLENIPLTQEDVLHPQEGDVIVQNTAHDRDTVYLREVFRNRLLADPGVLVLHDAGVDLGLLDTRMVCPDVCVVRGVKDRDAARGSFDTVAEGARPELIVEVVSPSTRGNDLGAKVELYHRALVPVYVIVDRRDLEGPVFLRGYRLAPDRYETLEADERGRLWLASVGLWLGVGANRVVCYDGDTEVGDYDEVTRRLIEAEAKAAEEARAREAMAAKLDQERQVAAAKLEAAATKLDQEREVAAARLEEERKVGAAKLEAAAAKLEEERKAAAAKLEEERKAAAAKLEEERKAAAKREEELQAAAAKLDQEREAAAAKVEEERKTAAARIAQEKRERLAVETAFEARLAELQAQLAALRGTPPSDPSTP